MIAAPVLLLAAAIAVVAGPSRAARYRLRRLLGPPSPARDPRALFGAVLDRLVARRTAGALTAGTAALVVAVPFGPVAAVLAAAYCGLAAELVLRARARRRAERQLADALDGVASLAGDLRAGLSPHDALRAALPLLAPGVPDRDPFGTVQAATADPVRGMVARRLVTAWRLAEASGAALAEVLDRLDAELRSVEQARRAAEAQTAGTRTTAMLLAALPLAGVLLGYGIGADPVQVLLHTTWGAACALGTLVLQVAGLLWSMRLSTVDPARIAEVAAR